MKQLFTTLLFLSIFNLTANAQCSAGTQAQLQSCFTNGSTPITLTATIALVGTLTIPNSPDFVLYIGAFDITGGTWQIASGNPKITASVNAAGATVVFTKNAPNKITDISPLGGIRAAMASVLPVELLDFRGTSVETINKLTWATATEINSKGFYVERLQTKSNTWENLGFVAAKGNGSTYQFTDAAPQAVNYYHLRQIDNDGRENLSKTIAIQTKGKHKLLAYPNPVSNTLTVEAATTSEYQIYNFLGQKIRSNEFSSDWELTTVQQIDVSELPEGNYILKTGQEQVQFYKN